MLTTPLTQIRIKFSFSFSVIAKNIFKIGNILNKTIFIQIMEQEANKMWGSNANPHSLKLIKDINIDIISM